jgi:hypothetical protein
MPDAPIAEDQFEPLRFIDIGSNSGLEWGQMRSNMQIIGFILQVHYKFIHMYAVQRTEIRLDSTHPPKTAGIPAAAW